MVIQKRILILLAFFLTNSNSYSQEVEDKLNLIQVSFGVKNPYGVVSIAYTRRIIKEQFGAEFRAGFGVRNSLAYGAGTSIYMLRRKKFGLMSSLDFTGNIKGVLSYDDEGYSDKYSYSQYFFLSPHIDGRLYLGEEVSLELKLGYSFLINQPTIVHLQGNMDYLNSVNFSIGNGLLIGIGINGGW